MNNKRFLHGTIATAITAGVVILVLLLNILCTVLANKGIWYIDFTEENLYNISKVSTDLLDDLDPAINKITIYFLADPDELDNASLKGNTSGLDSSTWGMRYVYQLAKLYASTYDFITVDTLDLTKDAEYIRTTYASTVGTKFDALDVIIDNCYDGVTHNFRVCTRDSFFTFEREASQVYAANGEYRFTSTILSLSGNMPTAYFLTGHGELVGDPESDHDFGEATALVNLFADAGFASKKINLLTEDFPPDVEDSLVNGSSVVVIYGPQTDYITDFKNESDVNELTKLRKYVNAKNHHLMVFFDSEVEPLTSLEEYLYDYWGIEFLQNKVIADTSDDRTSQALSEDGRVFVADYVTSESSVGSALTSSLFNNLDSIPDVVFSSARTIGMRNEYTGIKGFYESERTATLMLSPVFTAPKPSAAVYKNGEIDTYSQSVYDKYHDLMYDDKYKEFFEFYTSKYDTLFKEVYDVEYGTLEDSEYSRLYSKKYKELYDEYYNENLKEDSDIKALEKEADKHAIKTLESDRELLDGYREAAKAYADVEIAKMADELKSETEKYIVELAERDMDAYLAKTDPGAVMTLTYETWSNEKSNNRIPTYVLAAGTTSFTSEEYLSSAVYGNRDVMFYTMRLMGKEIVPFEIDFVKLESEAISTDGVNVTAVTVALTVVPAILVLTVGVIVLVKRRKHN